ncbi:MAG: hypothetical protein JNK48_13310 [Bryobacterales bacterium]|nr:hypothetical protein [Bryobacterales bacterium]
MIAFLRDEQGANVVAEALLHPNSRCFAHALNLCEVFYDFYRAAGPQVASLAIEDLVNLGVEQDATLDGVWQAAGILKATLRRVSLADCFAIELAQRKSAALLTADHHEFDVLREKAICEIRFIR